MERTFLDVRIVHPNAPSYRGKSVEKIYEQSEDDKKHSYNQRVIQVERATFTPSISHIMNHLRTRLRFTILKSTLLALRGERGKHRKAKETISDLSFNIT